MQIPAGLDAIVCAVFILEQNRCRKWAVRGWNPKCQNNAFVVVIVQIKCLLKPKLLECVAIATLFLSQC